MSKTTHRGRIWVLTGSSGELIEDIDTDQIYHNAHLHITELAEMGRYALGNLEGWKDFAAKAQPGDILAAGRNFGAGSSRQQAVDCFITLKVGAIIAPSFGSIYFRNAVNSAFPVLLSVNLKKLVAAGSLATGDDIKINFVSGEAINLTKELAFRVEPMSPVQREIYSQGGLFAFGRAGGGKG
ncbi:MAG: 3-isopropylmalate dehydratase [Candidatus Aminicenantes bacterium RBG_16_63_16]|nr:MAG: 3-isopropylmalate dehydratase [Candidatus Aminicenantes bacterium RBG_16_63_16]